jgi:hypothetical protein
MRPPSPPLPGVTPDISDAADELCSGVEWSTGVGGGRVIELQHRGPESVAGAIIARRPRAGFDDCLASAPILIGG